MSDKFTVEIISPDQTVLKQETNEAIIPSFEGQMGILNNHIPLITFLRPGIVTIKKDEDEKKYYVEEGTVEFSNNNLLILTSTARDLANLDKNIINELLQKAEANLNTQSTDKERYVTSYKLQTLKGII